jgi:transposase
MAKLTTEQIMVGAQMVRRGLPMRQLALQLGVTEGAVRYRLKQLAAAPREDGRTGKRTSLDGKEEAVRAVLEGLECWRVTGEGRPAQAQVVYEVLVRDHGYLGSYKALVRHLVRRYGRPPVRAYRRVETPPGVQAQHDWFEARTRIGGEHREVQALVGVLSHSRARFCWVSGDATQLAWHTGHLALFERYGGVPLWVRIDNLKTGVAQGAGATAVLNESYEAFARACGFGVDPCRPATGSDKGKVERGVRTFRQAYGALLRASWPTWESLQAALDERSYALMDRLLCPVTGTPVREAFEAERRLLKPPPGLGEPFDVVVARRVSRDCLVSFEGRRYSVPFRWVGREVEVLGTLRHVVVRAEGEEVARHPRGTQPVLVLDPAHFEGESTDQVLRPTPLGHRARLQMAGLGAYGEIWPLPDPERVRRPLEDYVQLVEVLG